MSRVEPSHLLALQNHVEKIRNFCILAHVDHGKTTLSDSLVSSNGIISSRLAGKLRFLDSTEEEQKRGITMHSSAIALLYRLEDKSIEGSAPAEEYLINLVDSPGHIDFSSDVSTAARLCDGALIVVDVLEGVCTQTHAVIYKALRERMRPCLVLNKIDRLIIELKLTPSEAFQHLRRIIENVNALAITLVRSELMKEYEDSVHLSALNSSSNNTNPIDIDDDEHPLVLEWTFAPEKGNIQFASALDGWGFGLMKFINYYHKKLGLNKSILRKYLFDDYSINLETKKIMKIDYTNSDLTTEQRIPMFVSLVLEPLWEFYSMMLLQSTLQEGLAFMKEKFNIVLPNKEINTRDLRLTLQSCMRRWLPLADSLLRMVVKTMPNPREAQKIRASTLLSTKSLELPSSYLSSHDALPRSEIAAKYQQEFHHIIDSIENCATDETAPLVVFISKMMSIRVSDLTKEDIALLNHQRQVKANQMNPPQDYISLKPDDEIFMALGRVFSGRLSRTSGGDTTSPLYVLGHKHDPLQILQEVFSNEDATDLQGLHDSSSSKEYLPSVAVKNETVVKVSSPASDSAPTPLIGCYMLLGPSAYPAQSVPAGNIVGIIGLDDYILKTATITDHWCTYPLKSMTFQAKPMLKVAIEPTSHKDLKAIEKGLHLLYQYDPVVEIGVEDNGQHTMTCLGELHLDQCVKALTERFAKCEVKVSEPLISFRETILPLTMMDTINNTNDDNNTNNHSTTASTFGNGVVGMMTELPPPWSDIPGLNKAKYGSIRLVLDNQNLAITFQCFPLALNAANYLEKEMLIVNQWDDQLFQCYSHMSRQMNPVATTTMDPSTVFFETIEKNKEFQTLWEQFLYHLLGRDGETESTKSEELYQEISLLSPEARQHYLQAFFSAWQSSPLSTNPNSADYQAWKQSFLSSLISFGPKACPTNLLCFSATCQILIASQPFTENNSLSAIQGTLSRNSPAHNQSFNKLWNRLHPSIVAGFHEAVTSGYLMAEPVFGIGYVLQKIEMYSGLCAQILSPAEMEMILSPSDRTATSPPPAPPSPLKGEATSTTIDFEAPSVPVNLDRALSFSPGQLISMTKDHLRLVLLSCPLRIVEPMYQCNLQCDQSQIGNLYAVLSRRRGNVYQEDIIEGTTMFLLSAYLPVAQSFQFTSELLKKTSGSGTAPQLSFSHWKLLLPDPFWKPRTEEEKEEFGDMAFNEHNLSKLYINMIRKRKGLPIDEQIVVFAEKQRTLNKKK